MRRERRSKGERAICDGNCEGAAENPPAEVSRCWLLCVPSFCPFLFVLSPPFHKCTVHASYGSFIPPLCTGCSGTQHAANSCCCAAQSAHLTCDPPWCDSTKGGLLVCSCTLLRVHVASPPLPSHQLPLPRPPSPCRPLFSCLPVSPCAFPLARSVPRTVTRAWSSFSTTSLWATCTCDPTAARP